MPSEKLIALSDAATRVGYNTRPHPERFTSRTGIQIAEKIKTHQRTYHMVREADVEEWLTRHKSIYEPKASEKPLQPAPQSTAEHDISLCTAAINAQCTRIEHVEKQLNYLFEKLLTLDNTLARLSGAIEANTEKIIRICSELGIK